MMVQQHRPRTRPGTTGARAVSALFLAAILAACGPPPGLGMEALTGATVVDVITGRALSNAVVLVRDGKIIAIGGATELNIPRGATITDLRQRWLIPGLIDAHAHLQPWGLASSLRYGVTAVRDLHDGPAIVDIVGRMADSGPAPHSFFASAILDEPPLTNLEAVAIAAPDQSAAAVAEVASFGASWVLTYPHVTPPILASIVLEARLRHLPVAAHLGLTDAMTAARLGVATIEHLSGVPEAAGDSTPLFEAHRLGLLRGWTVFERSWSQLDTAALAVVARDLAARGVLLVPTLVLHETFARLDDSAMYHPPELASVPDSARANWNVKGMIRRAGLTRKDYPVLRAGRIKQDFFVHAFMMAGGRVAAGTNTSAQLLVPGAALHTEMELLVHAGLSPLEALRAATLWGAEMLHADSLGRLRAGATADLVVLGASPLADIRNSREIVRVMLHGTWLPR